MFTGIVEEVGKVVGLRKIDSNLQIEIECSFISEIQIDQSIAHDGVCLTVTDINESTYFVDAIVETLEKSNLSKLEINHPVNLERCLKIGDRLDGHMVQGHVDTTAICRSITDKSGSWTFTFSIDEEYHRLYVNKGSICVNGVSLTVINSKIGEFSVAIIPYTYAHTNFDNFEIGTVVNIEFDIIGKYINQNFEAYAGPR